MPTPKRPVVAIDRITGEVTEMYRSVQEAADAYMLTRSNADSECRRRSYPLHRFEVLRFADDTEPIDWLRRKNRCIVATDGRTVHAFPTVSAVAENSDHSRETLMKRISRGKLVSIKGTYMLARYVDRPLNRNAKVVRHA